MTKPPFLLGAAAIVAFHALVLVVVSQRLKRRKDDEAVIVTLPEWAKEYCASLENKNFTCDEEMMRVAIDLSRKNVEMNTGGPFGCAIFETEKRSGKSKLFSVGVNRVVPLNNSTLHGEMVAIQFAHQKLQNFSLGGDKEGHKEYCLYTSCEPCAMCLGGTLWCGVSRMVCSATKADAEAIGFNEGPVFPESYEALKKAGVQVDFNVLRDEAAQVLQQYGKTGIIYNG